MMSCSLRRIVRLGLVLAVWCGSAACWAQAAGEGAVIPRPIDGQPGEGTFALNEKTVIPVAGQGGDLAPVGRFLRDRMKDEYGVQLVLHEAGTETAADGGIQLSLVAARRD